MKVAVARFVGVRPNTKSKIRTSIAIPIRGKRTPAELVEMITEALAELETRPFELYKNCNLYVTPVAPPKKDGGNFQNIEIKEPYHCAADDFDT